MKTTFIYGLMDPRDNQLRYVGKSNDPEKRLQEHLRCHSKNNHLDYWIMLLNRLDLPPRLRIIEECQMSVWQEREKFWIRIFKWAGVDLINITPGGEGLGEGNKYHWSKLGLKPPNYLTDAELIDKIMYTALIHKRTPRPIDLGNQSITIYRRFGSWEDALRIAGLPIAFKEVPHRKYVRPNMKGMNNPRSIVDENDVIEIRRLHDKERYTQKKIGELFGLSHQAVSRITRRKTWKHI